MSVSCEQYCLATDAGSFVVNADYGLRIADPSMRICLLLATYKICNSLTANSAVKRYVAAQRFFSVINYFFRIASSFVHLYTDYGEYTVAAKPIKGFLISRKSMSLKSDIQKFCHRAITTTISPTTTLVCMLC